MALYNRDGSQGKVREIHGKLSKSGKNEIVFANVVENVDIKHFISMHCQRIRDIHVTFAILLTNISQRKHCNQGQGQRQGQLKLKKNGQPVSS